MGTAGECTNCHVLPAFELNLTKAKFIRGRVNSQQPVSRMFVYIIRRLDRSPFCFIRSTLNKLEVSRKRLYMDYIYPGCMSYVTAIVRIFTGHVEDAALIGHHLRHLPHRTNIDRILQRTHIVIRTVGCLQLPDHYDW